MRKVSSVAAYGAGLVGWPSLTLVAHALVPEGTFWAGSVRLGGTVTTLAVALHSLSHVSAYARTRYLAVRRISRLPLLLEVAGVCLIFASAWLVDTGAVAQLLLATAGVSCYVGGTFIIGAQRARYPRLMTSGSVLVDSIRVRAAGVTGADVRSVLTRMGLPIGEDSSPLTILGTVAKAVIALSLSFLLTAVSAFALSESGAAKTHEPVTHDSGEGDGTQEPDGSPDAGLWGDPSATYEDLCGPYSWTGMPRKLRNIVSELVVGFPRRTGATSSGAGAHVAGCLGDPVDVPSATKSEAYLVGQDRHGDIVSLVLVSPDRGVLVLGSPATAILEVLESGRSVASTGRLDVDAGDLYLVNVAGLGTRAFVRRTKNDSGPSERGTEYVTLDCDQTTRWYSEMLVEGRWLWPVAGDGGGLDMYDRRGNLRSSLNSPVANDDVPAGEESKCSTIPWASLMDLAA